MFCLYALSGKVTPGKSLMGGMSLTAKAKKPINFILKIIIISQTATIYTTQGNIYTNSTKYYVLQDSKYQCFMSCKSINKTLKHNKK